MSRSHTFPSALAHRLSRAAIASSLLASSLIAIAADGTSHPLAEAHAAYYQGRYGQSVALYQQLADRGNTEAAERAGFMLLHGEPLYGRDVRRDEQRARQLLLQAARAGRSGAGFVLNLLEGSD